MIERKTFIPFGQNADASIDYLVGILADARATTLQRVEGISKAELHWQYADGWNSIGALLAHIIAVEEYFRIEFIECRKLTAAEEALWMPGLEMGKYIPQLITNDGVDVYEERLAQSRARMLEAVRAISATAFKEKREGYNPNTGCNLAWVLYHMAEDEVHHRGQISILRKLYKARATA